MTQNKTIALVSGANRGIGLAICEALSKRGVRVYMGSRDVTQAEQAIARQALVNTTAIALDVTDDASMQQAITQIEAEQGRLDILINNAGIARGVRHKVSQEPLAQIRDTFEVNFFGTWMLTQHALPLLQRSGEAAHIINISSGYGSSEKVVDTNLAYCSSKAAMNSFTRALACELEGSPVKVTCMTPGWVRTKMGGVAAPRTPQEGAETVEWLALDGGGEHGGFYKDREPFPW